MAELRLRPATHHDLPLLARMNAQLIQDEGHRNPMSEAELAMRIATFLAGDYEARLFEVTGPVGYALYRYERDYIYLRQYFIAREERRRGYGRHALALLERDVWRGHPRLRLEVLVDNSPALAFWRAVGLQEYSLTLEKELA